MTKKFYIFVALAVLMAATVLIVGLKGLNDDLLRYATSGGWLFPVVVLAALVDSINPCAFSVLLVTIGFLMSLGRVRGYIIKVGSMYVLGILTVYVLIGLGTLRVLSFLNTPHIVGKIGAGILIVWGVLVIIEHFFPNTPIKMGIPHSAHKKIAHLMEKGSVPAAFMLGAVVGMYEFPCTGGPYLMILGLLHDSQTFWSGAGYLALYNFIFVSPLLVILFIASEPALLTRAQEFRKNNMSLAKFWEGIIMIMLGLLILALS